jgi:hypothetical protein
MSAAASVCQHPARQTNKFRNYISGIVMIRDSWLDHQETLQIPSKKPAQLRPEAKLLEDSGYPEVCGPGRASALDG